MEMKQRTTFEHDDQTRGKRKSDKRQGTASQSAASATSFSGRDQQPRRDKLLKMRGSTSLIQVQERINRDERKWRILASERSEAVYSVLALSPSSSFFPSFH